MTTKVRKAPRSVSIGLNNTVDVAAKMQLSTSSNAVRKASRAKLGHPEGATTVQFGSVTVEIRAPRKADIKRNIKAGQLALARAKAKIVKPGVKIEVRKGVPLFHADPKLPGRLIRVLDGKREQGKFVNGKFKTAG